MKLYSVTIPNLPADKSQIDKVARYLKDLKGFKAITPVYPSGTLVFFETLNDAIGAKNIMEYDTWKVGDNIMECEATEDMQNVTVLRKAKQWQA